jgi:hypothetical protein
MQRMIKIQHPSTFFIILEKYLQLFCLNKIKFLIIKAKYKVVYLQK